MGSIGENRGQVGLQQQGSEGWTLKFGGSIWSSGLNVLSVQALGQGLDGRLWSLLRQSVKCFDSLWKILMTSGRSQLHPEPVLFTREHEPNCAAIESGRSQDHLHFLLLWDLILYVSLKMSFCFFLQVLSIFILFLTQSFQAVFVFQTFLFLF